MQVGMDQQGDGVAWRDDTIQWGFAAYRWEPYKGRQPHSQTELLYMFDVYIQLGFETAEGHVIHVYIVTAGFSFGGSLSLQLTSRSRRNASWALKTSRGKRQWKRFSSTQTVIPLRFSGKFCHAQVTSRLLRAGSLTRISGIVCHFFGSRCWTADCQLTTPVCKMPMLFSSTGSRLAGRSTSRHAMQRKNTMPFASSSIDCPFHFLCLLSMCKYIYI